MNPAKPDDIFISYRRRGGNHLSLAIREHLVRHGYTVFRDITGIPIGQPFPDKIRAGIEDATDIVVILAGEALSRPPMDGEADWFVEEIELAVRLGKNIIPVASSDFVDPNAEVRNRLAPFLQLNRVSWTDAHEESALKLIRDALTSAHRAPQADPVHKPNNLPYASIGELFKGRDEFLEQIKRTLGNAAHKGKTRAAAVTATAAVHGLGGIGKTRAAIEYGRANADDYTALLFIRADSPESLQTNLAGLCGPMVLNLPEQEQTKAEVQVAAALRWLQDNPGWFLIFDNVDSEEAASAVELLLGQLSEQGQVLITSRLSRWKGMVKPLELDVLTVEACVQYLLEATQGERHVDADDADKARALAEMLGQLPLALTQAAAYISEQGISLAGYIDAWSNSKASVMQWFDERQMQYPASIAVTWQTSFAQLDPPAQDLLRILAWFVPDPIPESLLEVGIPAVEETAGLPATPLRDAMLKLRRYSLITRDLDALTFSVHRLVQEVTRQRMGDDPAPSFLKSALAWLNASMQGDPQDVRTWPVLEPLAPHAEAAAGFAADRSIHEGAGRLLNYCGLLHKGRARYSLAEPLYRRALAVDEARYGSDHPEVATDLNNLAMVYKDTNRLSEAESLCRRALEIYVAFNRATSHRHPNLQAAMNNYASLLRETGKSEEEVLEALRVSGAESIQ